MKVLQGILTLLVVVTSGVSYASGPECQCPLYSFATFNNSAYNQNFTAYFYYKKDAKKVCQQMPFQVLSYKTRDVNFGTQEICLRSVSAEVNGKNHNFIPVNCQGKIYVEFKKNFNESEPVRYAFLEGVGK